MKRLIAFMIIVLIIVNGLFAATLKPDESLGGSAQTFLNIGFPYNPMDLERVTFGFTASDDLTGDENSFDITGGVLELESQQGQYLKQFKGVGTVNLYWILRLRTGVTASIYIDGPLVSKDDTSKTLNFSLTFQTEVDGVPSGKEVSISSENPKAPELIYSRQKPEEWGSLKGFIPIDIETEYLWQTDEVQSYSGSIGVVVKIV